MVGGIAEESISFVTNFLTQILVIVGGIAAGTKYVLAEIKKNNERLSKKLLGDEQTGKAGKGGLLDELRTELQKEFNEKLDDLETKLVGMVSDSHKDLLNEFKRTSIRISYMSRDLGKVEKNLEKMSNGRYSAAKQETDQEYDQYFNDQFNHNNQNNHNNDGSYDLDSFDLEKFNKKRKDSKKQ